jgi:hypothetical protein
MEGRRLLFINCAGAGCCVVCDVESGGGVGGR